MNTILVYVLMLKPAILAAVFTIGLAFLLGAWALPYLRAFLRRSNFNSDRVDYTGTSPEIGNRS